MRRSRLVALGAAALAVALAQPATAGAAGSNIGGGQAEGSVTFSTPIPALGQPCGQPAFTLSGTSRQTFVINTIIKGYVGPVTLSGFGGSPCEGTSGGNGQLTLTATGRGPTGSRVDCIGLTGAYTRTATNVQAQLGGTCTVNSLPGVPVTFVFEGEFVPEGATGGTAWLMKPIWEATFNGAFTVLPA